MTKPTKLMLWVLAGLAGATALLADWSAEVPAVEAKPVVSPTGAHVAPAAQASAASPPAPVAASADVLDASGGRENASSWRSLYAAPDLFPQLLRLHQALRTGSYAAVRALNQACVEATLWASTPGRDPLLRADVNHPDHAKRLAARHLVMTRCAHTTDNGAGGMLLNVGAGDSEGQRFMRAYFQLQDPRGKSVTELSEALAEVARQGHPEVMLNLYAATQIAQGWGAWISPEATNDALRAAKIAELRFTAPGGAQAEQDIRLAFRCFMYGECSYRYDDVSDIADPSRRARILQMAAELEEALRAPDPAQVLFTKR